MWAALGGLVSGLFSAGGSIAGGAMSMASSDRAARLAYDAQKETNELNYKMFKENMEWQTYMANTAHQREVSDLRDAGLNPILSATGGSGAVTPSIATPHMDSPGAGVADQAENLYRMTQGITQGLSSAADVALKVASVKRVLLMLKKPKRKLKKKLGRSLRLPGLLMLRLKVFPIFKISLKRLEVLFLISLKVCALRLIICRNYFNIILRVV